MKKLLVISFVILSVMLSFACTKKEKTGNKPLILKFGHLANTKNVWHKSALKFKEEVEKRSEGTIIVKVYPSEELGKEVDVLNGIISGTADFTLTGTTLEQFGATLIPLVEFPYLFRDEDHLLKAINGKAGEMIEKDIIETTPFLPIGYFLRGPRYLTSNKPINHPDELRGMLVRVPNSPIAVATWSALGAKPTPMAFSEVFTALQQGTIAGQENPYAQIFDAGFYEVQKYINNTAHVRAWIYVLMSQKRFNSLNEMQQKAIREAGMIMQDYQHKLYREGEQDLKSELEKKVTFDNEVDQKAFAKKIQENLLPKLTKPQRKLYDDIARLK